MEKVKKQKWYQSKPLWRAVFSAIVIITKESLGYEIPVELIDNAMTILLWSVVGYGVRNNPSLESEL